MQGWIVWLYFTIIIFSFISGPMFNQHKPSVQQAELEQP